MPWGRTDSIEELEEAMESLYSAIEAVKSAQYDLGLADGKEEQQKWIDAAWEEAYADGKSEGFEEGYSLCESGGERP